MSERRGMTLTELLVVIAIILAVTIMALPTVLSMMQGQQAIAAAQLLQGGLMQAQSEAMRASNRRGGEVNVAATEAETLRGLRLVPEGTLTRLADGTIDPAQPLVCSTLVPLTIPPAYQEGRVSIYPGWVYPASVTGGRPCLVLEESPGKWVPSDGGWTWQLNSPTSWAWNLRAGERVVFGSRGTQYVVVGPIAVDNPEQFVNYGPPGNGSGFARDYPSPDGSQSVRAEPEVLLLANGRDDNLDGYVDNGWDGLDNDSDEAVDELDEWVEIETWSNNQLLPTDDDTYRVIRRPVTASEPRGVVLPQGVVIDLTGWDGQQGRSRLVVNRYSGAVDILLDKTGRFTYDSPFSGTSSVVMGADRYAHFWIGGRADIVDAASLKPPKEDAQLLTIDRAGVVSVVQVNADDPSRTFLDARRGSR
jgi:prepilin-type N-terminal cleavage/methylation domain-containing protein